MPFGLFFDFMDGKIARWRKKSSLMGQELDSLADLVCSLLAAQDPGLTAKPVSVIDLLRSCTGRCSLCPRSPHPG